MKVLSITAALVLGVAIGIVATLVTAETPKSAYSGPTVIPIKDTKPKAPNSLDVYELVNAERNKSKVRQLNYNKILEASACDKANDMIKHDYWSHATPSGASPFSFILNRQLNYTSAGENLFYGYDITSKSAMNAWMSSPTHKDNIVNTAYTDIGICFVEADNYQKKGKQVVGVQHFIAR